MSFITDLISDIPFVGDVFDSTLDSLGLSRHGRDQVVSQQNQKELMQIQQQYNIDNFDRQFLAQNNEFDRRYNMYQSPQALIRQYNDVGLNSSALAQHGSAGFGGAGAAVNPSPVSVPSVSPSAPMQQSSSNSSDYIDALSHMKLSEAQKDEIYSLLKGKILAQDDQHKWQQVLLAQHRFELELEQKYGKDKRANEIANLAQQGLLFYLQGMESKANYMLIKAKEELAKDEHKFNEVKFPKFDFYLDAIMSLMKSETSRNYAEGAYSSALANTENALREFKRTLLENESNVSTKTMQASIDKILNESAASEYLPENAKTALELAQKENNLYYFKAITGIISDCVGTAINARTGGRIASAMEVRNRIQERIQQFNEKNGVTEQVINKFDKKGNIKERTHTYKRSRPQK